MSRRNDFESVLDTLRQKGVNMMDNGPSSSSGFDTDALGSPILSEGDVTGVVSGLRDLGTSRCHVHDVPNDVPYANDIIATLRDPFIVLDASLRIQAVNRSFCHDFRVSPGDTVGRMIHELGNGQWNIPCLRALLEAILPDNHSFCDFEVDHDFPVIGRKIMLLNARRVESANESRQLILLAIEDITERRQAEAALRTSEVRYRRLFETARDGILILDADTGEILDANPFMTNLLGYSREEFLGRQLWEIGLFSDRSANRAAFLELQEHGYVRYDHLPLETRAGGRADVEFVSNVYHVEHRHIAQCNIRDTSERSRLERKTEDQAQELLDLHRRKDEFLAMLSHELRNPLAPISYAVEMLRLQEADENEIQRRARNIIDRQLGQLRHLVDDLLEVSRFSTGKVQLHRKPVAVNDIVHNAVDAVRSLIDQHRHELTVSPAPEPIWLDSDAARMEQVVVNLLTNAAKYTPEGGHVSLIVTREDHQCVLRVRDTGVGIAPELLPRIFDLFTQAERSLDRSEGGLGIGLALVQRLTELHGGTVGASSSLGQGSEFVVRLPVIEGPGPNWPTPEATQQPPGVLRVLVVDDNLDAAESLATLLEASGYDVRTVHDGSAVLNTIEDYPADVVLLDIGLPGMDGYEVARRIRRQPGARDVVLVAVTGYGQETDRQASLKAGFDHHLVKPADFSDVQDILAGVSRS